MVGMINHLGCHAAVYNEILSGDEACIVTCQKESQSGYVFRPAHSSGGMLTFVLFGVLRRGGYGLECSGVNPTGADGVYTHPARQARGQSVGQGADAALCRRITLGVGLGHERTGGRDIDDGCARREAVPKQFCQHVGRGNADMQHMGEVFKAAVREDAPAGKTGVVDQAMDRAEMPDDAQGKIDERLFLSDVPGINSALSPRRPASLRPESSSLSIKATRALWAVNLSTMHRPIPLAPPVMTQVFPFTFIPPYGVELAVGSLAYLVKCSYKTNSL